ncbi:MAG: ribokinase [Tannerellaceae bacterium]|nr:ribokinase [Tannerellaceae bacterium]
MKKEGIVIVGSTNVDMIAKIEHLPLPGETVGNAVYSTTYGGKGANQAVAVSRSGGKVTFISNVGDDLYGNELIPYFQENGMNVDYIYKEKDSSTGVALIFVAETGENCIAVAPGANGCLRGGKVEEIYDIIARSEALLLQLEIPYETVAALIDYAWSKGTKVIFNPAPAIPLDTELLSKTDVLIVNETEAEILTGIRFDTSAPDRIAGKLLEMGPGTVILTLGKEGAWIETEEWGQPVPAYTVEVKDTTAAGDTFCGAFTVRWLETDNLLEAVRYATAAAGLSVMNPGAQPSIPVRETIEQFIENFKLTNHENSNK